ncbi:MAG: hypothetical protein A2Y45_00820 [Tenericutes bacterium GWC2_34_14]|nr:MAG: hypothetical protein A2Z84_02545 [Tenericutes bacterium GWA2_35_7]OHE29441.1 MAG: hypothetical protein A2Y45_00820 [Tenericutes bacterium GWC2_34_14]OHE34537.1 MAG: hypothetical protein A2012_08440 [Tenericutes bacterium GWE2_34_108]OHE35894.1 MAG: hypothetical protein A2Y46_03145 [Tenericutes bacterium GWF1_35_14]OHE39020.1 MAG: hypothetical protein A2Y44_06785 [Tenericutes bacterium GWF2_35_184]OHE42913.1 MAG: hypothetical protein A2221_09450 [Tenericutes bacterium RIFOXYA2_FULL_36_3
MKTKLIVMLLLIVSITIFVSTLGVIYARQNNNQSLWYNMFNDVSDQNDYILRQSYAALLHLDETEQNEVIELLAVEIEKVNWTDLSDEDIILFWNEILIDVMSPYSYSYGSYGMMGNRNSHCGYYSNVTLNILEYPLSYMHASLSEKEILETSLIDFLRNNDLETDLVLLTQELYTFLNVTE